MVRENGELRKAGWDEALHKAAENLGRIRSVHGPDSIGVLSSAKCTNEENYLMSKFTRAVLGTNNIDHCARLCHSSTVGGLAATFGSGAMTNSISEIDDARVIFVIGSNTTEQHPMIGMRMLDALDKGAMLIVADPRETMLARMAHIHLRHRCGTDATLLMNIMNTIVKEGLVDRDFVRKRTENFDEFDSVIGKYTPEEGQKVTGVSASSVRKAARLYASEKRSMLFYSMGITQHVTGVDNVKACADLVMLTGHIGLPMSGLNPLRGQNNVQGACDMGALPNVLPGYQQVSDKKARNRFQRAWGRKLSDVPGLTLTDMHDSSDVRALYIMGENPVVSSPDSNSMDSFLDGLEFLVVQDIFLTETARHADVLFPAASFAEKNGTFTNTERRVQLVRKAVQPPGEALSDWKILCELAAVMDYDMCYRGAYEVMEEIALLTPSYGGMLHHRLDEGFGIQWPSPDEDHPGTPYLHRKKFARGLGSFMTREPTPPAETPDEEFPYVLTTGRIYFQYHTGSMTRRTSVIEREEPECFVEISPEDAERLGLGEGSQVRVRSRRGEMVAGARVTGTVPEGTVFIPFHYAEARANLLTNPAADPGAKIPEFKVCAVSLEAL
jgi:formate dehydrogenase alpha subunit